MQYDTKTTKLTIKDDKGIGISSSVHGSNLDALGFNVSFIISRKPSLAVEIMKIYEEAQKIRESDPMAPSGDFKLANEELLKFMKAAFNVSI